MKISRISWMFVYFNEHVSRTTDHAQNFNELERDLRTFNKKSRRERAIDFNVDMFKKKSNEYFNHSKMTRDWKIAMMWIETKNDLQHVENVNRVVKKYHFKKLKISKKYSQRSENEQKVMKTNMIEKFMTDRYHEKKFDMFYNEYLSRTCIDFE